MFPDIRPDSNVRMQIDCHLKDFAMPLPLLSGQTHALGVECPDARIGLILADTESVSPVELVVVQLCADQGREQVVEHII